MPTVLRIWTVQEGVGDATPSVAPNLTRPWPAKRGLKAPAQPAL